MQPTFGKRLQAARKDAGFTTQESLGDVVGVSGRMIRAYETNESVPGLDMLRKLRKVVGEFDAEGDPVEVAVRSSELVEWRQDTVIGFYKRHLSEQSEGRAG